ncbi:MAG: N-glycosylase/DNA lyase [Nanoarchaeota archaeon]|nr:N-glycosylase/DNA lyase [Nanoarchaeota archaeon]
MANLISQINKLKKSSIKKTIDSRIKDFRAIQNKPSSVWFTELCFCILTANSTAERCIDVHTKVGKGFVSLPESRLQKVLKQHSCRFHTKRAGYIAEARKYKDRLKSILQGLKTSRERREWLEKNIKGIGYKEASHFLRNIGYEDVAIIDFHIIDILEQNRLIKKPKILNKERYLEIEQVLKDMAQKLKLNLAELDLYLWYLETGKVLK